MRRGLLTPAVITCRMMVRFIVKDDTDDTFNDDMYTDSVICYPLFK